MTLKQQAEDANWKFAHEWHAGIDLTLGGVNLADALTYDVLRVIGAVWKNFIDEEKAKGDGATADTSNPA